MLDADHVRHHRAATSLTVRTPRDYWIAQCAGWGALAALGVYASWGGGYTDQVLWFSVAKVFCALTGLGLSHGWRNHLRRHGWIKGAQDRLPLARIGAGLLLLSVLQTGAVLLAELLFRNGALLQDRAELPATVAILTVIWYIVFALWTLLYTLALARRHATRLAFDKLQLEIHVKDAELRALQAQVNPHFFFNSMNSIRALMFQDVQAAARAMNQLAAMMRHNLQTGLSGTVRLDAELAALQAYLGMEKLRFEERLQLSQDIDPGLEAVALPPMLLQTLVENAIKHGVERSTGPCAVRIEARRADDTVLLRVANQGKLAADSGSTRVGLANAGQRLHLLFGAGATCRLAEHDGWVIATVTLPREKTCA
ncbi:sensor histidine kinase [Janthinobacterium sp. BJB401]|uniref:sensor histidine kinase n=1 Tax=Janthinobacterium sp. BJB401 TaxID=2745934 RepID=UPI0034E987AB